ncbi:hypothetical protein [Streptomyces sp. NPDC058572]|uniref:hypothetical protein n=1 Tax=Streptomyces sp. NPDC058572 TaxID=3346546 RepID=UPI00364C2624
MGVAACDFAFDKNGKGLSHWTEQISPTQHNCTNRDQNLRVDLGKTETATDNSSETRTDGWSVGLNLGGDVKPGGQGVGGVMTASYNQSTQRSISTSLSFAETFTVSQGATAAPGDKIWIDRRIEWAGMRGTLRVRYKIETEHGGALLGFRNVRGVEYKLKNYQFLSPVTPDPTDTTLIPRSAPMTVDELGDSCRLPDLAGRSTTQAGGGIYSYVTAGGPRVELPALEIADGLAATSVTAPSKKGLWWMVRNYSPNRKVWMVRVEWGTERCDRYEIWGRVPNGANDELTRIDTVVANGRIDTVKFDEPARAHVLQLRCLDDQMPGTNDGPATLRSFEVYPEL